MSIDLFNLPDVPVTVTCSIYDYEAQYMLCVISTPMVTTESASGQFFGFYCSCKELTWVTKLFIFLSSPKADKVKSFIELLTKHARYL